MRRALVLAAGLAFAAGPAWARTEDVTIACAPELNGTADTPYRCIGGFIHSLQRFG